MAGLQLHHAQVIAGDAWRLPKNWGTVVAEALAESRANPPRVNNFERSVLRVLNKLGISAVGQEFCTGYWIDLVLKHLRGRKVALECDGVVHHCVNWDSRFGLIGAGVLRDRILEKRHYRVVHVFDSEWHAADEQGREALLRHKLGI